MQNAQAWLFHVETEATYCLPSDTTTSSVCVHPCVHLQESEAPTGIMDVMRAIYRRVAEGLELEDGLFIPVGRQRLLREEDVKLSAVRSQSPIPCLTLSPFAALQFSSRQDRALFNDGRNVGLLLSRDHGQQLHGVPLPKVLLNFGKQEVVFHFMDHASHDCSFSLPPPPFSLSPSSW